MLSFEEFKKQHGLDNRTEKNKVNNVILPELPKNNLNQTNNNLTASNNMSSSETSRKNSMPTFRTIEEAQQYARNNNINVTGNSPQVPQLVEKQQLVPKIGSIEGYSYKSEAGDTANIPQSIINEANKPSPIVSFATAGMEQFGESLAKPVVKWVGGGAYNLGQLVQGKKALSADEMQQSADYFFEPLRGYLNQGDDASKVGEMVGNTAAYLYGGKALGNTPLAYGATSAIQASGNTSDAGDIAVSGATGTAFGYLNNAIAKPLGNLLGKIPATSTNVVANAAKNFATGFGSTGGASYITGTAKDLYNMLRGRKVDNLETLKQSAAAGIIGGLIQTRQTINDVRQAKAQLQADLKTTSENIANIQAQMEHPDASPQMRAKLVQKLQPKIEKELEQLASKRYLGQDKVLKQAIEELSKGNTITAVPQATLSLPEYSGQNAQIQNNIENVSKNQEIVPQSENISQNNTNLLQKVENSSNTLYNQGRGEINGTRAIDTRIESPNDEGKNELAQLIETERDNSENLAKTIKTKNFSSKSNTISKYEKEHNSTVSLIDGNQSSFTDSQGNIYLNEQQIKDYGEEQLLRHETVENLLSNHTDDAMEAFLPLIDEINQNEKGLTAMFKLYSAGLNSKESQALALNLSKLTKEIFCDFNASTAEHETAKDLKQTLIENFGEDLYNKVVSTIQGKENQIYHLSEDSNQSSFSLPSESQLQNSPSIFEQTNKQIQAERNKAIEEGYKALNLDIDKEPSIDVAVKEKTEMSVSSEKPAEELSTYKKQMFKNNAQAINDLIKIKNDSIVQFNEKIARKKRELAEKKDHTTKIAQNLKQQITNLEKRKADSEAKYINQIDRLENRNATINKLRKQVSEDKLPTRKEVKERIITEKDLDGINLDNVKNLNKFIMNNTTPQRVNEKIFDRDTASKINDRFFKPIKHNEAERIRFLNKEREDIQKWGIKPKSDESAAMQMYGEGEYVNPETGEISQFTLKDLKQKFPNDWERIKNAAESARIKYDNYLDAINKELNKMGYDSIPKLKNYFRHFEETKNLLDTFGIPSKENALPTDLNGMTADLKPGKNFFANALKRTGNKTNYDAITGMDGYLEGASKLMYHTEDIQNIRTLHDYIAGKYGQNADLEGLSKQEFETRVKQIQDNHLSEYASWLNSYANNLAGKKAWGDRGAEEDFGRKIYGTLNTLKKQVGSNLTGLNINSALSNFISAGQGLSSTSKIATLQGLVDTIKNIIKNDDFIDKSDFLTTRFGSDKLSKTWWEKASNAGQIFMSGTDYFTANLITRSKYHEYLNKGYPEQEAIEKAGEYADRLMAGRGLGDMPNFFNSKTLGFITQFQLENVNQFDSMFHDNFTTDRASEQTKYDAKTWNEKIKSKVAESNPKFYNGLTSTFVLAQLFTAGWVFNKVVNKLGGTGGAFDPIGTVEDFAKDYQKDGVEVATKNLVKNVLDDIPYANLLTGGGRIPTKDSLPNLYNILAGESSVSKELTKLINVLPPTGGGQARKTYEGLKTLINNGEYGKRNDNEYAKWILDLDNKNWLEKIGTSAQALLFGKYGPSEAKEYLNNGYKGLTVTQTNAYKEAKETGMSAQEFKKWIDVLDDINPKKVNKQGKEIVDSTAKKAQLKEKLNVSELTDEQKKILYEMFYKVSSQ